jgi:branched-chain amino acid aminotransferase
MSMMVFINGQLVAEAEAKVSVFDRGFTYGDGLFETMRVSSGRPFRCQARIDRLRRGASELCFASIPTATELSSAACDLIRVNRLSEGLLRINLSRGAGPRGYLPSPDTRPTLVMTLHPANPATVPDGPAAWRLATVTRRLDAHDPLQRIKTCNKLPHILAAIEARALQADEALLLNRQEHAAEGARSNLFWLAQGQVLTPPLSAGALPGLTRGVVLDLCRDLGIPAQEQLGTIQTLRDADAVFLTLSSFGVIEVSALDGQPMKVSPVVRELWRAYTALLARECQQA